MAKTSFKTNPVLLKTLLLDCQTGKLQLPDFQLFDEAVDIHYIFPKAGCEERKIPEKAYDTVVNKTPLSYRTNRIIGGVAPSKYLHKLEAGRMGGDGQVIDPPIARPSLDLRLRSHGIDVDRLRADDFEGFMSARRDAWLDLVSRATGHRIRSDKPVSEEGEELTEAIAHDCGLHPVAQ